jgi:hypothetical protein
VTVEKTANPDLYSIGPGGHPFLINSPDYFAAAFVNGWIVDGRGGGLVQGRLHSEGNIVMISPTGPLGCYELVGHMEGGEYLMSMAATELHRDRLTAINADKSPCDVEIPDPPPGRTLFTHAEPHDKLLVISRQFIINRVSTRRCFAELVALNAAYGHFTGQFFTNADIEVLKTFS